MKRAKASATHAEEALKRGQIAEARDGFARAGHRAAERGSAVDAARWLLKGAGLARRLGDDSGARMLLENAHAQATIAEHPAWIATAELRLGEQALAQNRPADATPLLSSAWRHAHDIGHGAVAELAAVRRAGIAVAAGKPATAERWLSRAESDASGAPRPQAERLELHADLHRNRGDWAGVVSMLKAAIASWEVAQVPARAAMAWTRLASAHRAQGRLQVAKGAAETALELAVMVRSDAAEAAVRTDLAHILGALSERGDAELQHEAAAALYEGLGQPLGAMSARVNRAQSEMARGALAAARALFGDAEAAFSAGGHAGIALQLGIAVGQLDLRMGALRAASLHLEAATSDAQALGDPSLHGRSLAAMASVQMARGDLGAAGPQVVAAQERLNRSGRPADRAAGYILAAEYAALIADWSGASDHILGAAAAIHASEEVSEQPRIDAAMTRLHWRMDPSGPNDRAWADAVAMLVQNSGPFEALPHHLHRLSEGLAIPMPLSDLDAMAQEAQARPLMWTAANLRAIADNDGGGHRAQVAEAEIAGYTLQTLNLRACWARARHKRGASDAPDLLNQAYRDAKTMGAQDLATRLEALLAPSA